MKVLNDALDGRKYPLGNIFTVTDIKFTHMISWGGGTNTDFSDYPNIARWFEDFCFWAAYQNVAAKTAEEGPRSFMEGWQYK